MSVFQAINPHLSAGKLALIATIFFAMACASAPSTVRTDSTGNVPLLQVQNDHYSEAVIFLEGVRLTEVRGGTRALILLPIARIPLDGEMHFTVRMTVIGEAIQLPTVAYHPGRAIRIILRPQLSASSAQE